MTGKEEINADVEKFKATKRKKMAGKMSSADKFHQAVEERRNMLKRGNIGELLSYAAMRRQQKGGD